MRARRGRRPFCYIPHTLVESLSESLTHTPGLWTKEQVRGWRRVTDAVHRAGGRIIAQLWHTGAISHPELQDGAQPVCASNIDPGQISVTPTGRKPTVKPRPLTKPEIQDTVADFARAARNAMEAGLDGDQRSLCTLLPSPSQCFV